MLFGGETAESYYEEGLTSSIKGDYEQALVFFHKALSLNPVFAAAHHQIAKTHIRLGAFQKAIDALNQAVALMGRKTSALADLAQAYYLLGKVKEARTIFSEILQISEKDTRGVLGLAFCAFADEQWVTAINLVQHASTLGRLHFDAHFLIARAAAKTGAEDIAGFHFQQALEQMNHTLEITEEQVTGYFLRGLVHASMGGLLDALRDMDSALRYIAPDKNYFAYNHFFNKVEILVQKGVLLKDLNRIREAKETGEQILALAPDNQTGMMLASLS